MTNKEVQDILNTMTCKSWFKTLNEDFNYNFLDVKYEKKGFLDIYQYVRRQCNDWEKINFKIPNEFNQSKIAFLQIKKGLDTFLKLSVNYDEFALNSEWKLIKSLINNLNRNNRFPIEHPKTNFLIETSKISDKHFQGAYYYFFDKNQLNITSGEQFAGMIMAYEFQFEDATKIPNRRKSEKSSNAIIRNNFERTFTETSQNVTNFLDETKSKSRTQAKEVLELVSTKKEEYEKWVTQCKLNDQEYTKYHLERIKDLEELYQEKLKLEAPAKYWKDRAVKLSKEGDRWLNWLIGVTIVSISSLGAVLFFISDGTLKDLFDKTGSAVRWSIVFVTFVSFLAYGIRTFAKLMFSSYHLVRDAEEREQLAYVYLALKKEQSIDETERHLIMQSLFSRADSGLLKDDSSPTMPGGSIIEKLMGGK